MLDTLIHKKKSITKLLSNSEHWLETFEQLRKKMDDKIIAGDGIKHMSYAKQRVDSEMTPAGRFILFFEAMLMTAITISIERKGRVEAEEAELFLAFITAEHVVQLGMWGELGNEVLKLARFLDTEAYDLAALSERVDEFLQRIACLFTDGHVREVGYTHAALRILKKTVTFRAGKAGLKSIGGAGAVSDEMFNRCLKRMQNVVALLVSIVDVEFPRWEVFMSFRVLNLNDRCGPQNKVLPRVEGVASKDLERLATFFNLDLKALICQFEDYVPEVIRLYKTMGAGATWRAAWQSAVTRAARRSDMTNAHPQDQLNRLLQRYIAWCGCTTSGVEQSFGKAEWLLPKRRGKLETEAQEDEVILHVDQDR